VIRFEYKFIGAESKIFQAITDILKSSSEIKL